MRARGLGSGWVRRCATVVTQALELARKRGLIHGNPAKAAARPRTARTKPVAPSPHELQTVLADATRRDEEIADAVALLASTGMRKGELLALRWADVDLVRGELPVAASVADGGPGVGLVRKAIKRADWRDVPLTDSAIDVLDRQRVRTTAVFGSQRPESTFVLSTADGSAPIRPDTFTDRWALARGSSSITLQHVRHYAATVMLDAGESYGLSWTCWATARTLCASTTMAGLTSGSGEPSKRLSCDSGGRSSQSPPAPASRSSPSSTSRSTTIPRGSRPRPCSVVGTCPLPRGHGGCRWAGDTAALPVPPRTGTSGSRPWPTRTHVVRPYGSWRRRDRSAVSF
jgi:site-specific recombinase XerC